MIRGFLIALCMLSGLLSSAQVESTLITGNYGPMPLETFLSELKSDYPVKFAYDPGVIEGVEVSVSCNQTPLQEVLNEVLLNTGIGWKPVRKTIVLFQNPAQPELIPAPSAHPISQWSAVIADAESGEGLPFAVVKVSCLPVAISANEYGQVNVLDIPSDTCIVSVYYTGYETRSFRLNSAWAQKRTVTMKPLRTFLPQAEIVAEYSELMETGKGPGVLSFNPADLQAIGTSGENDVMRGAQLLPGVSGTTESSNGIIIRGSDPDQTLVQFDDFTVFHLDHFFGNSSAINADMVKQVRVYKGISDAAFGGRTGGLVRITGKEGNKLKPSASVTLGTLSGSVLLESPVGRQGAFILAARRSYTDLMPSPAFKNLYTSSYNQGGVQSLQSELFSNDNRPDFYYQDLTAKWSTRSKSGDRFNVSGYIGRDKLSQTIRMGAGDQAFTATYSDESQWGNSGLGARWHRERKKGVHTLVSSGISRYQSNYFSSDSILQPATGVPQRVFRDERFQLTDFNLRTEHGRRAGLWGIRVGAHVNRSAIGSSALPGSEAGEENVQMVSSLYMQTEGIWKSLEISAGLRIGHFSGGGNWYPEWRVSVSRAMGEHLRLKSGIFRTHQFIHRLRPQSLALNHSDLWVWSGARNVPVLRSDQYSAGFNYTIKAWTLDVEGYYKGNQGVMEYLPPYLNAIIPGDSLLFGSGNAMGVDVLLGYNRRNHHVWLAYSLMKTSNDFGDAVGTSVPEWFDQRHEVKVTYQWEKANWEFASALFIGTGRPFTPLLGSFGIPLEQGGSVTSPVFGPLNSLRMSPYYRLDLAAGWKTDYKGVHYAVRATVFNAWNQTNERDIRYTGVYNSASEVVFLENRINMTGIIPGIQLLAKW
jgi:ferric enterobactin receptor